MGALPTEILIRRHGELYPVEFAIGSLTCGECRQTGSVRGHFTICSKSHASEFAGWNWMTLPTGPDHRWTKLTSAVLTMATERRFRHISAWPCRIGFCGPAAGQVVFLRRLLTHLSLLAPLLALT